MRAQAATPTTVTVWRTPMRKTPKYVPTKGAAPDTGSEGKLHHKTGPIKNQSEMAGRTPQEPKGKTFEAEYSDSKLYPGK